MFDLPIMNNYLSRYVFSLILIAYYAASHNEQVISLKSGRILTYAIINRKCDHHLGLFSFSVYQSAANSLSCWFRHIAATNITKKYDIQVRKIKLTN